MSKSFTHLHLHSQYSLLDGMIDVKKLCAKAKELGMNSVALTDHGNMFGSVVFYNEAKAQGIKPILGMEVYVAPEGRKNKTLKSESTGDNIAKYYHLLLLVKNEEGYKNILQLASKSYLEGFYYRPRVDKEILAQHSEGLICCSGCMSGEIPRLIQAHQEERAKEVLLQYQAMFRGDFYYEMMRHGLEGQEDINQAGYRLAKSLGIPVVATNDAHYLNADDTEIHRIILNIQSSQKQEVLREYDTGEFYVKSPEQMWDLFHDIPEAVENTQKIADACSFDFKFGDFHFPKVPLPAGMTEAQYLEKLCWDGFAKRYPNESQDGSIGQRVKHELDVINRMGFPGYFLVVQDFIVHAKDKLNMEVGCARGSVGGSVVAYCLRITELDPIKYDLMFERFLNPERVSMPDIDIDFPESRRLEVIDYVTRKYGADCVGQIVTLNQIKARTAIRDVARVLNVPLSKVDRLAKSIPMMMTISEAETFEDDDPPALRLMKEAAVEAINADEETKNVIRLAKRIEGTPRHAGVHAAGVVIADKAITEYVPLAKEKESVTTQFDMKVLESLGLLKMDFLGLRTMDVIRGTVDLVKARKGIEIDIHNLPMDDSATCNMLCEGHTKGVFQADSSGITEVIKNIAPRSMFDCVPIVALYRPGPLESGMVETYIKCRHGQQPVEAFYPTLKPMTDETYGILLYQEQVMKAAQILSGFSIGEADELRKAIGKKNPEKLAKLRKKFVSGAKKVNPTDPRIEEIANDIYSKIEFFGRYCFNKAHSAAYGLIMYQTAYLKANYPTEYMCSLLTSVMGRDKQFSSYIREARRMGLKILPPSVNKSLNPFSIEDEGVLRFGFMGIKGITDATGNEIITARDRLGGFVRFYEFLEECKLHAGVLKALILSGTLDDFGHTRKAMIDKIEGKILNKVANVRHDKASGQTDFFDGDECQEEMTYGKMNDGSELEEKELFSQEKALLGVYLSKHPIDKYRHWLQSVPLLQPISNLIDMKDGQPVVVAGVISEFKAITTKSNQAMAFLRLEDRTGDVEVVVFASTYANFQNSLAQDRVILLEASVQIEEVESGDEDDAVHAKEAKLIAIGVINLEKIFRDKKPYLASQEFLAYKKKPRMFRGNKPKEFRSRAQETAKPKMQTIKIPRHVTVTASARVIEDMMGILTTAMVPGPVSISFCVGCPGGAGIVIETPLTVDLKSLEAIFRLSGVACQVVYHESMVPA